MSNITQIQSKSFIGIDLHSDNAQVCVLRSEITVEGVVCAKVVFDKKISFSKGLDSFWQVMNKFCQGQDHIAAVESTYNWYWMADGFEQRGWNLVLADPSTVSQDKRKATNDKTDAAFIAERLRHGTLHYAKIMNHQARSIRDLARYRAQLVQDQSRLKITLVNLFTNHTGKKIQTRGLYGSLIASLEEGKLSEKLLSLGISNCVVQCKIRQLVIDLMRRMEDIENIEIQLENMIDTLAEEETKTIADKLQAIKGCGPVISRIIALEIGEFSRFKSAAQFVSYCRLAPTSKLSNGKSKGMGNAKNGNAYLSWALTELANMMVRFNPVVAAHYKDLFSHYKLRVKAIRTLAAKIARGLYYVIKDNVQFDINRLFAH